MRSVPFLNAFFVLTAAQGHAQDFRDQAGDAAIGRKTLAVILPQTSGRWLLLTMIFFWSIGLAQLWHVPAGVVLLNLSLAGACGIRLVIDYSEASDKSAYWWYNVRCPGLTLC